MNTFRKTIFISLAAASIGVVALPAAAIEPISATEIDDVLITADGVDLGGPGFAGGEPTSPARVEWQQAWFGSSVTFNGTIHFDEVLGSCARVQLTSYAPNGNKIEPPAYSTEECANNNGHVERFVSVQGQYGASEVKVRLQTLLDNGEWVGAGGSGSVTVTYGPSLGTSNVSISRESFDLGKGDFVGGTAADPAIVTWSLRPGTTLSMPEMTGTLYMKKTDNLCGRVMYYYRDVNENLLDTRDGNPHCVDNSDLHTFGLNLDGLSDSFSGGAVNELNIVIQRSSRDPETGQSMGNWEQVGATTAYLPSVIVPVVLDLPQTLP